MAAEIIAFKLMSASDVGFGEENSTFGKQTEKIWDSIAQNEIAKGEDQNQWTQGAYEIDLIVSIY